MTKVTCNSQCILYLYRNGTVKLVEIILRRGRRIWKNDGGVTLILLGHFYSCYIVNTTQKKKKKKTKSTAKIPKPFSNSAERSLNVGGKIFMFHFHLTHYISGNTSQHSFQNYSSFKCSAMLATNTRVCQKSMKAL
jgi:hypothetical protein